MSIYRTQHGDSPAIIARKHGVSVGALLGANPHKSLAVVRGKQTWQSLGLGEPLNVPGSLGDVASDTAASLAAVDPCDQTYVGVVCSFQTLVGLTPDGKYGSGTAAKGTALGVRMPPPCSPRPAWWAPAGKSNCGQLAATPSAPGSSVGNAASAAYSALSADSNYCLDVGKGGTAVNTAIHNFKTAWNAQNPSNPVPVGTGKYEPVTASALSSALSGQSVPPGCGSPGSPNQPVTPAPALPAAPVPGPVAPFQPPPPAPAPFQPSGPVPAPVPGPMAPAAVQALTSVNPCDPSSAAAVCAAQDALGIGRDGKYGTDTSTAARRLVPSAPAGCSPRPAWWAPTGQSSCPGAAPQPGPAPGPSGGGGGVIPGGGGAGPAVVVPASSGSGGLSTGAIVAGAVGAVALVGIIAAASMSGKGGATGRRGAAGKRGAHGKATHRKPAHKGHKKKR